MDPPSPASDYRHGVIGVRHPMSRIQARLAILGARQTVNTKSTVDGEDGGRRESKATGRDDEIIAGRSRESA